VCLPTTKRELSTSKHSISQYWLASHRFPTSAMKRQFCLWSSLSNFGDGNGQAETWFVLLAGAAQVNVFPKVSYGNSLSGCGSNIQPSNWEADTFATELFAAPTELFAAPLNYMPFVVMKVVFIFPPERAFY